MKSGESSLGRIAWPPKREGVQEIHVPRGVAALGQVASQLAAVLRPVVDDVGEDQPARHTEIRTKGHRL